MPLTLGAAGTTRPSDITCLTCLTLTVGAVVIDDLGDEVGVHGRSLRSPSSTSGAVLPTDSRLLLRRLVPPSEKRTGSEGPAHLRGASEPLRCLCEGPQNPSETSFGPLSPHTTPLIDEENEVDH